MGRAIPTDVLDDILGDWVEDNGRYVVVYWTGIDTLRCRPFKDEAPAQEFAAGRGRVFKARTVFEEVTESA